MQENQMLNQVNSIFSNIIVLTLNFKMSKLGCDFSQFLMTDTGAWKMAQKEVECSLWEKMTCFHRETHLERSSTASSSCDLISVEVNTSGAKDSLASQPDLLREPHANERPSPIKKEGRQHLSNSTQDCPLAHTRMCIPLYGVWLHVFPLNHLSFKWRNGLRSILWPFPP